MNRTGFVEGSCFLIASLTGQIASYLQLVDRTTVMVANADIGGWAVRPR